MVSILAGGNRAVVTCEAGANDLRMVDCECRVPRGTAVAVFAGVGCIDMDRMFAGCIGAVMTGKAIATDVGVIKYRRDPKRAVVAVIAIIAAGDMARRFACGRRAVMAGAAAARYCHVIHVIDRAPGRCRVTAVAGFRRGDVPCRFHRG